MSKKKMIFEKKEPGRAGELLFNTLYYFPFNFTQLLRIDAHGLEEQFNNEHRMISFWQTITSSIELQGYRKFFVMHETGGKYRYSAKFTCNSIATDFTNNIMKILTELPQIPNKKGSFLVGTNFKALSYLLSNLYTLVSTLDDQGGWKVAFSDEQLKNDFIRLFQVRIEPEFIYTADEFVHDFNDILVMFYGANILHLFPDGTLGYADASEESHQEHVAIRALTKRKMPSVTNSINDIRVSKLKGEYNKALWQCRVAVEDFLKDFLKRHSITSFTSRSRSKDVKDAVLGELVQVLRDNSSTIFKFPAYFKENTVVEGYDRFNQSIGQIFAGITNNFAHGKGSPGIKAKEADVATTFTFLISVINMLLAYEK